MLQGKGVSPVEQYFWLEGYDAAGRRTARLDSLALTNTFAYNVRSELIEAAMDTNEYKYAYDSIGNRQPSSQGYAVPGWAQMNAQSNSYVANDLCHRALQNRQLMGGSKPSVLM